MRGGRSEDTSGGRDGKRLGRREGGKERGRIAQRPPLISTHNSHGSCPAKSATYGLLGSGPGGRGAYTWEVAARGPGPVSPIYVYKDRHPLAHHSVHRVDNYKNMPPTPCGSSEM